MAKIAYTSILVKEAKDGMHWTLGLATENEPGYSPIKETGDPRDPFYVAKGPTRFATKEEADAEADYRNASELGILDREEAFLIVASSIGAQNRLGGSR